MARSKTPFEVLDWRKFPEKVIAGVDEVGRGCLAGPVFASAVILDPSRTIRGITDSKLLTPEQRSEIAHEIRKKALAFAVGMGTVAEIESINILQASLLAMRRCIAALAIKPELILVDGNQPPRTPYREMLVIKGDLRCEVIGAASILAKVARDEYMIQMDKEFPGYGLAVHKGYGTPEHRKAIKKLGPTNIHRKTFAGVAEFVF